MTGGVTGGVTGGATGGVVLVPPPPPPPPPPAAGGVVAETKLTLAVEVRALSASVTVRVCAGRVQGDQEGVETFVGGGEGVVNGHTGALGRRCEVDGAGVRIGLITVGIDRADLDREGRARCDTGRRCNRNLCSGPGDHVDEGLGARDRDIGGVLNGEGLPAGGLESDRESVNTSVGSGERVGRGQPGLSVGGAERKGAPIARGDVAKAVAEP